MAHLDGVDVGEQQQGVGADLVRQQCGREVLVDDRLAAVQETAGVLDNRHTAAAGAGDDRHTRAELVSWALKHGPVEP